MKGLAAASANSHIVFSDGDETETDTTEANGSSGSSNKVARVLREAFLQKMRKKLDDVHQDDKVSDSGPYSF